MDKLQSSQAGSKDALREKLKDLVAEKQETQKRIKELDQQIQRLENGRKSKE